MKKKHLLGVLLTLCLAVGLLPAPALAASSEVALKLGSPWCAIDTQVTQVDESNAQVTPYAVQVNGGGYTLLPIRRVLEAFGGSVEWVPATNGVLCTLNGHQVELAPGSAQATVDGVAVTMDVPAEARNDRTFVPVRFVSENLGLSVSYEPTNQIVVVSAAPVDQNSLTSLSSVKALTAKLAASQPAAQPVTYQEGSYALPSGTVSGKLTPS